MFVLGKISTEFPRISCLLPLPFNMTSFQLSGWLNYGELNGSFIIAAAVFQVNYFLMCGDIYILACLHCNAICFEITDFIMAS